MPLIIICGTPVSGKTTRAVELKHYFENKHGKQVNIVSEEDAIAKLGYEKNEAYLDSQKEKRVRGYLKSEVIKLIGKDNVVILDGSNYIKGYRYELYCASKASKSTQCTIYTIRYHEEAWFDNEKLLNSTLILDKDNKSECSAEEGHSSAKDGTYGPTGVAYTREVFDALTKLRFEEPNSNSRWDSPLFTVQPTDTLDLDAVYSVLYEKKPPPPNMSTQNVLFYRKSPTRFRSDSQSLIMPPLTSTNFLYVLDQTTQDICKQILEAKKLEIDGEMKFLDYPGCHLETGFLHEVNPQKLTRLRRQFLTYAKMNHSNENAHKLGRYFIQYLNKTLTN